MARNFPYISVINNRTRLRVFDAFAAGAHNVIFAGRP
jgi:hypothetical protein